MSSESLDVLIVDDSEIILEAVRLVLEEAGFRVVTTDAPMEVPGMIRRLSPTVVLVDISMPVLDGDRLVSVVRSFGSVPDTRILLYSDRPVAELRERAKDCSADGYLQKNSDFAELLKTVQSATRPSL